jgi:tyrosyl-tRNA synthetase
MVDLLAEISWRGLKQDATPGLPERLAQGPITAYVGFDPTAPSLQVGNLVPVMLLAHLQRAGGRAIVLMGGGTGMIGDPSGKNEERPLLERAELDANLRRQEQQFRRLLPGADILNNADWLRSLSLVEFLRDVGKHFTVSVMLQKESIKARMQQGISYTEFSYMLTQAYDFWHLYRERNCEMQMGGSDQWGNITAGIELIRRREGREAHGLSAPLLTTSSGTKFGKSEGRAVWLDPERTPTHAFYNFWLNSDDRDVEKYLKMFTFRTAGDIAGLMERHGADPGKRIPHHALAQDLTTWVHGAAAASEAQQALRVAFVHGDAADLPRTIEQLARSAQERTFQWETSRPPRAEDLFVAGGLASSKSDARRLLAGKGLYLNGEVPPAGEPLSPSAVVTTGIGKFVLLQKGKKTYQPLRILGLD